MASEKRIVIYVNVKPRRQVDNEVKHPEHVLVEESVDIMQGLMDFMGRPIINFNKMLKYFLKAVTFSD